MRTRIVSILFILVLGLCEMAWAQDERGERLEQLKIAFLTERLDLSVKEGQSFWPLYNEFSDKRKTFHNEKKEVGRIMKDRGNSLSEKELRELINKVHGADMEMLALEKKFAEDCIPVLGPAKTALLMTAEEDFKKRMMDRLKDQQGGRPGLRGR